DLPQLAGHGDPFLVAVLIKTKNFTHQPAVHTPASDAAHPCTNRGGDLIVEPIESVARLSLRRQRFLDRAGIFCHTGPRQVPRHFATIGQRLGERIRNSGTLAVTDSLTDLNHLHLHLRIAPSCESVPRHTRTCRWTPVSRMFAATHANRLPAWLALLPGP